MHVFVTGERGVGKSTTINRAITKLALEPAGFVTEKGPVAADGYFEVVIKPAAKRNQPNLPTEIDRVGSCCHGNWQGFPETFDRLGVEILNDSLSASLLLMDEIGFMESKADKFQTKILDILAADTPVLGVIKPKFSNDFLNAIRSHPKVTLLELKPGGWDDVLQKILANIVIK